MVFVQKNIFILFRWIYINAENWEICGTLNSHIIVKKEQVVEIIRRYNNCTQLYIISKQTLTMPVVHCFIYKNDLSSIWLEFI
jgi:hypothetical protein